ncbi:glucose 1-dehydrogenase [Erythrobacter alti]|uniref:SDR family NAD(P)-dependent oxidoreductase n=1 Tax=Erythrobacter alti TaxID=1896145 RepID=UPI0030F43913
MIYPFEGKVAVVTGASGGIGRASALAFGRSGASVLVSDVQDEKGQETVDLIINAGGTAHFQHCDVSDEAQVDDLVATAISRFGTLDFAHNNAGINRPGSDEWTTPDWALSINVNLNSVMYCMRAQISAMLAKGGGAIVNTASVNGLVGNPSQPGYVSSKHGVIGLTRSAALRYAKENIRVNAVCPGVVDTPMVKDIATVPQYRAAIEAMTPMGRMAQPEEIASAVLWLCSNQSSFVTGHPLVIDGGATAI